MKHAKVKDVLLEGIAERIYVEIASAYPICSFSDEFYFFPQAVLKERDWNVWDDFSAERVAEVASCLQKYEQEVAALGFESLSAAGQIDAEVLQQVLRTLREQLSFIAPHKTQPTFHLTILAAGLAEALESHDPAAWGARVAGVPAFLQRAVESLKDVPVLFLELGLDMLCDLQRWVEGLQVDDGSLRKVQQNLNNFGVALKKIEPVENYRLSGDLLDVLLRDHLQCGLGIDEIESVLRYELEDMEDVLHAETALLLPGKDWLEAEQEIPFLAVADDSLRELYLNELARMESHCIQSGLIAEEKTSAALQVAPVPDYLSVVRASDAYAATPGCPPAGGVFFVMGQGQSRNGRQGRTLEYRMTAAHEVWPGHHLLDISRWSLERSVRRPIESPLFYEGWACLAEELMARTGYLSGPWDRFILAKRRAERAARGLVDIGLQSGRMKTVAASELLARVGYRPQHAEAVIAKYLLRPGYQVCYTLGLKQGLGLLERFAGSDLETFVETVLSQGEVGFPRLENIFSSEI